MSTDGAANVFGAGLDVKAAPQDLETLADERLIQTTGNRSTQTMPVARSSTRWSCTRSPSPCADDTRRVGRDASAHMELTLWPRDRQGAVGQRRQQVENLWVERVGVWVERPD